MDFLKKYGISGEKYKLLKEKLSKENINYLELNFESIDKILNYFTELGINNIFDLIIYRFDLLCTTVEYLEDKFKDFDINFIKYIIEEDIQNLIILGI